MSHLVRLHVKSELVGLGFDCRDIANTGLFFTYGQYPIRVLKAEEGGLPVPGHSRKMQDYYGQEPSLELFPQETQQQAAGPNLIVLWDTNEDYYVDSIKLICPRAGGDTKASVEKHWEDVLLSPRQWAREQGEENRSEDDLNEIRPLRDNAASAGEDGEDD